METTPHDALHLVLTPAGVETQCAAFWHQFRSPGQVLSALVALQSLFTLAPPGERIAPPYREIQDIVTRHAEIARARLLLESETRLLHALESRDVAEVTRIHGALSRNGFWQAAASAVNRQSPVDARAANAWMTDWCDSARARAESASGYPDALDLRAAGVSAEEYAAMRELCHCLQTA